MDNLHIAKGEKTPLIEFDFQGELRIEGRSVPENPIEFYRKPVAWVKDFTLNNPRKVNLHICLEHFNTASSKVLLDIFKYFEPVILKGANVNLYWYYDEESSDMMEAGEDYASIVKVPFHFVKKEEMEK
jgi:hypothetical protein